MYVFFQNICHLIHPVYVYGQNTPIYHVPIPERNETFNHSGKIGLEKDGTIPTLHLFFKILYVLAKGFIFLPLLGKGR